jgi:hypothetical protein
MGAIARVRRGIAAIVGCPTHKESANCISNSQPAAYFKDSTARIKAQVQSFPKGHTNNPNPDFCRTMVECYRASLRLLVEAGALPAPEQGLVGSILHGSNPMLWEQVRGFEINFLQVPLLEMIGRMQIILKPLGLALDADKVTRNYIPMASVNFNETGTLRRMLANYGYAGTKYYFMNNGARCFQGPFEAAMRSFLDHVLPSGSTIVVFDSKKWLRQYEKEVFLASGYRDRLPELISRRAFKNLEACGDRTIDFMLAGWLTQMGGSIRVYQKDD